MNHLRSPSTKKAVYGEMFGCIGIMMYLLSNLIGYFLVLLTVSSEEEFPLVDASVDDELSVPNCQLVILAIAKTVELAGAPGSKHQTLNSS